MMSVDNFRERLKAIETDSGLNEAQFARSLGVKLTTYRAIHQGGAQGPALATILCIIEAVGEQRALWLLTGQEPDDAAQCPPPGYDLVRLPRGDMQRLTAEEADRLEKALAVLRASGGAQHYALSVAGTIDSFYKALLDSKSLSEPGQGRKNAV